MNEKYLYGGVLMNTNIPLWHKQNLTLSEAAIYSNIGENRLSVLLNTPGCPFLLRVGNKRLIKREPFDEYIKHCKII